MDTSSDISPNKYNNPNACMILCNAEQYSRNKYQLIIFILSLENFQNSDVTSHIIASYCEVFL